MRNIGPGEKYKESIYSGIREDIKSIYIVIQGRGYKKYIHSGMREE